MFGWAAMTKTGPNDTSQACVVWALSMYFFFLYRVFFILTNVVYYISALFIFEWAAITKTDSNDARLALFGPYACFFFIYFYIPTNDLYYI